MTMENYACLYTWLPPLNLPLVAVDTVPKVQATVGVVGTHSMGFGSFNVI